MKTPQDRIDRARAGDRLRLERMTDRASRGNENPEVRRLPSPVPTWCDECGGRVIRVPVGDEGEAVCESCGLTFGWFE